MVPLQRLITAMKEVISDVLERKGGATQEGSVRR